MEPTEYRVQLQSVFNLGTLVRGLKLEELLQAMNRAESVGPILDPTLFQAAAPQMAWQKRAVRAALRFQREIESIIASDSEEEL
jgi:hypothetical protein